VLEEELPVGVWARCWAKIIPGRIRAETDRASIKLDKTLFTAESSKVLTKFVDAIAI